MTVSSEKKTVVERAMDLSEEVLESVGIGRQYAIEAVRKFVDTLDEAMPNLVDPSLRKKILDAALDLADQLGTATNKFARSIGSARARRCTSRATRRQLLKASQERQLLRAPQRQC